MNEDLDNINYSPIRAINLNRFHGVEFSSKTPNEEERTEFVTTVDETVKQYTSGLPMIIQRLNEIKDLDNEFSNLERMLYSFILFAVITMTDCMVASKYFILADTDYEKRYMRGKLRVLLNEGFKRLYGFDSNSNKAKSTTPEWQRILPYLKHFPPIIEEQYRVVTARLSQLSKESNWWKDERNLEIHLDAQSLYLSRAKPINEGEVMMQNLQLFDILMGVSDFLMNMNACMMNYLIEKYRKGELKE